MKCFSLFSSCNLFSGNKTTIRCVENVCPKMTQGLQGIAGDIGEPGNAGPRGPTGPDGKWEQDISGPGN